MKETTQIKDSANATQKNVNLFEDKPVLEVSKADVEKMDKDQLRKYAELMCLEYNDAYSNGIEKSASDIDDMIVLAVNTYTAISRKECFDELKNSENPMLAAVIKMTYDSIRICDKRVGEEIKVTVREIANTTKAIDLARLHKYVPDGIGADKNWIHMAEHLNYLCTCRVAKDIGLDAAGIKRINDSYAMSTIARQMDNGETPTSNTKMLEALTNVVHAMVGEEYKPLTKDLGFLNRVYSRSDSSNLLKVKCSNHGQMRKYLMAICNRVVTDTPYSIAYPELKNK